jgi:hypothetical protein
LIFPQSGRKGNLEIASDGATQMLLLCLILLEGIAAKAKVSSARFDVRQIEPNSLWSLETEENLLRRFGEHLGICS